jgi:hypothetical protein
MKSEGNGHLEIASGRVCKYDVALSFAGEDRGYVSLVADALKARQVTVFYDEYEKVDLWGKNLFEHLSHIYLTQARYTIIFISKYYATKIWTNHERRSAQVGTGCNLLLSLCD